MRKRIWLSAALLMLTPALATAQEAVGTTKKSLVQGNLGLGSPVGSVGLSYTYAPNERAQVEVGGGLGFSGYQLSVMPKLTLGSPSARIVLGVGPSLSIDSPSGSNRTYVGYWVSGEIGYQHTTPSGLAVLAAAGLGYGVAGSMHPYCTESCAGYPAGSVAGRLVPEVRIAIGRWF